MRGRLEVRVVEWNDSFVAPLDETFRVDPSVTSQMYGAQGKDYRVVQVRIQKAFFIDLSTNL